MSLQDKKQTLERLRCGESVSIELGCGPQKVSPSAIGIDRLDFEAVDIVGEASDVLAAFPDGSVDSVYSAHFLEHVSDPMALLQELSRVMKPGGRMILIVPHFSNPFYSSDPTHRVPFGLYTLSYYCRQDIFRRQVPRYGVDIPLVIDRVHLGFKSYPPRYLRHIFKLSIGLLLNSNMFLRELYEENLCWIIPCYEIRYELHRA